MSKKDNCRMLCDFKKKIFYSNQQPVGFKAWTKQIKYKDCTAYLPDGTIISLLSWVNNQQVLDSGSYTNFLLNIYNNL